MVHCYGEPQGKNSQNNQTVKREAVHPNQTSPYVTQLQSQHMMKLVQTITFQAGGYTTLSDNELNIETGRLQ